jgi:hypothetical protein
VQALGLGDDAAVLDLAARAELAEAVLVHVERTHADRVAAGQGDHCPLAAADQRPEHAHGRAELAHRG